jgi:predicted permease
MILDTLFPVFAIIFLGSVLRRTNFVSREFFMASDRLVYFIFFPAMLFWKIGTGQASAGIELSFFLAVLCAVLLIFALSTLYIIFSKLPDFQAGSFSQSCYRFNTYIGMAIILKAAGDEGVFLFAVLIGFIIPVINLLSVSILIWFSGKTYKPSEKLWYLARSLATNPIILGCLAGIAFSLSGLRLPVFIDNTLSLVSMITLPLALISIGSAFSFKKLEGYFLPSAIASFFKLVLLPAAGFVFMLIFGINDVAFLTGMIFFCLPTSTAIYVLSSQMNSDTELASASIVVSTLFSFVTLSVVLALAQRTG